MKSYKGSKTVGKKKHTHAEESGEARIHQDASLVSGQHPAEEVHSQVRKLPVTTSQQIGGDGYSESGDVRPKLESGLSLEMLKAF